MRQNSKQRPHNWCVVQAQLTEEDARAFHEIMEEEGITVSELLKLFVSLGVIMYRTEKSMLIREAKKHAASKVIEKIKKLIDDSRK